LLQITDNYILQTVFIKTFATHNSDCNLANLLVLSCIKTAVGFINKTHPIKGVLCVVCLILQN